MIFARGPDTTSLSVWATLLTSLAHGVTWPVLRVTVRYDKANKGILFPGGSEVKRLPAMRETWVRSLGREEALEKEMATHYSTLAWKIPWMEERCRLQSMRSQRVGHHWTTSLSLSDILVRAQQILMNECMEWMNHLEPLWPILSGFHEEELWASH